MENVRLDTRRAAPIRLAALHAGDVDRGIDRALAASLALFPLLPTGPHYLGSTATWWPEAMLPFLLALVWIAARCQPGTVGQVRSDVWPADVRLVSCGLGYWLVAISGAAVIGLTTMNVVPSRAFVWQLADLPGRLFRPMDQAGDSLYPVRVWLTMAEGPAAFWLTTMVLVSSARPQRRVRAAAHGCLWAIGLVSVTAIVQHQTRWGLHPYWVFMNSAFTRSHATLDDPNALGSFLVFGVGLVLGVIGFQGRGWAGHRRRVAATVTLLLALAGLATTGSRAAWAALPLAILMVMATYSGAGTDASLSARRTRRAARGLLLALVVLTGVWVLARAIVTPRPVVRPANAWQAAVQTLDPRTPIEDVLKNRHLMWRTALRLFGEEPLLGVGLGTFPRLYGRDTPGQRPENAHNFFLQTLAEAGLAGLLALTLLAGSVVLAMRPYVRGTRRRARRLALGLAVGLLAWLLTSITGHPALTVSNQIWLGSALAVGLAALRPPPTTAGPAAVGLRWSVSRPASQSLKRTIDVVVSAALLTVLLPLLALVALLIRLDSPGPALFRHRRVTTRAGSSDRSWRRRDAETCIFELIKFRTMWRDADPYARSPTTPDDPRITRVGRILRRTCLDELPQLWNVLRGDVSLVGPRPEMLGIVEAYDPSARQRLCVQPGLTGLWQLRGRRDRAIHEDLRWDLTYVRRRSLWLDLAILCETAWFALRRRNL